MSVKKIINKKEVPILYTNKSECCGCSACVVVCPISHSGDRKAISMVRDECGFLYPRINRNNCVRCNKCISVCPMK